MKQSMRVFTVSGFPAIANNCVSKQNYLEIY